MSRVTNVLLAAVMASLAAAEEEPPATGWVTYVGYDAPEPTDYNPQTHSLGGGRFSLETTSQFPRGPPPLDCYDLCYADSTCHGFVLWQQKCWFRGGPTQGPVKLFREKVPRGDMSLFIIYGEHPVAPAVGGGIGSLLVYVGGGLLLIVGAAFLLAAKRSGGWCEEEKPKLPTVVKQPEKKEPQRKGCDAGCMGRGKKSKALPTLV